MHLSNIREILYFSKFEKNKEIVLMINFDFDFDTADQILKEIEQICIEDIGIDNTICGNCHGKLSILSNYESFCKTCDSIVSSDNYETGTEISGGIVRISQSSSGIIHNSQIVNCPQSRELQIRNMENEYLDLRKQYIEKGGEAYPDVLCKRAAEYYNEIQQYYVRRSQNKRGLMASCFINACKDNNFRPVNASIAEMLMIPIRKIAKGDNFIRNMYSKGETSIDINKDVAPSYISTIFIHLKIPDRNLLTEAITEMIGIMRNNLISTRHKTKTQVHGVSYIIITRYEKAKNVKYIDMPKYESICKTKKTTIDKYIDYINQYHSRFVPIYEKYSLWAQRDPCDGKGNPIRSLSKRGRKRKILK